MPAVLREEGHAAWLTGRPEEAMEALKPYPSDGLEAWQVSRRLYANKAPDDEGLIERVGR
jgi:putative SOS response-associated peptidase YedK